MAEETLRIFPRGFIGHAGVEIGRDVPKQQIFHKIGESAEPAKKPYNAEITDIYDTLLKVPYLIGQFDIRERIIKIALNAFGFNNFNEWLLVQRNSDSVGEYHARFIEDTLLFVNTGKRQFSLFTWLRLLQPGMQCEEFNYSENFLNSIQKRVTGTSDVEIELFSLTDLVKNWCSRPNGIEDMYFTLYILFGRLD